MSDYEYARERYEKGLAVRGGYSYREFEIPKDTEIYLISCTAVILYPPEFEPS